MLITKEILASSDNAGLGSDNVKFISTRSTTLDAVMEQAGLYIKFKYYRSLYEYIY